jgi:hypothetical protein
MFGVVTVRNQRADLDETQKCEPPDDQMLRPPTPQPQAAPIHVPGNAKYAKWPKATTDNV